MEEKPLFNENIEIKMFPGRNYTAIGIIRSGFGTRTGV
jgi:hypothetical protein